MSGARGGTARHSSVAAPQRNRYDAQQMKRLGPLLLLLPVLAFGVLPTVALALRTGTLASFLAIWSEPGTWQALWGTLRTALGAAALSFALGFPLGVLLARVDLPGHRALEALVVLPSAVPPFILGMGWVALANPKAGLLNLALGPGTFDIYGAAGITLVLGTTGLPLVALATRAALAGLDGALEEAARLCGAGPLRTLATISARLALPAALSGAGLVVLLSASAFGVPYLLGVTSSPPTPTLTTRIYSEVLQGSAGLGRACALAVALLVLAGLSLAAAQWLGTRGRVRLLSGKGGSPRRMALPVRLRALLGAAVWLTLLALVVLPLLAVFLTSVQPGYGRFEGLTLRHWSAVLSAPRTLSATARSLALGLGAATAVAGAGLLIALARARAGRLGKAVGLLGTLAYAVPGTVLALGLLLTWSRDVRLVLFERVALVLALGNTPWLLLVAWASHFLALGIRSSGEALAQVDPSLEEAARVSGAGATRAFVDAALPSLRAPVLAAWLLVFLSCLTELTLAVLLVPAGSDVLGTLLFELQSYADPGAAAVIACAFVLLVLAVQAARAALSPRWKERPA